METHPPCHRLRSLKTSILQTQNQTLLQFINVDNNEAVELPILTFRPIVGPMGWNRFMFTDRGRGCLTGTIVAAALAGLTTAILDSAIPDASDLLIAVATVGHVLGIPSLVLIWLHWVDRHLLLFLLRRWECLYVLLNLLVHIIGLEWINFMDATKYTASESMAWFIAIPNGVTLFLSYSICLCSDCIFRRFFSRKARVMCLTAVSLIALQTYVRHGILTPAYDTEVCIFVCMPLVRTVGSTALTISAFCAKYAIALVVKPNSAMLLKANVEIHDHCYNQGNGSN
jgi:hypothetical protein